ncbi:MAG: oxidoreductase [Clostridiales Family XIII bacterium]|jgi:nitrogenase molybdenum-iron protein alpha/beta subunit|nr:oxidoreductase [Clostridiales Family XIII bacterium]
MSDYTNSITPDGLTGSIFAAEGVRNALTILNGPTGCKFYHSAIVDSQTIRQSEFDPHVYSDLWYFGHPRVPCTYLDRDDYIYGSEKKLREMLDFVRDNAVYDLICIINSPAAALIGDDLKGFARKTDVGKPVVVIESPGYSTDVSVGYEAAALHILKALLPEDAQTSPLPQASPASPASPLSPASPAPQTFPASQAPPVSHTSSASQAPPPPRQAKSVNILGLSIYHKYHRGDVRELARMFSLCGIHVNCFLCGGGTVDEIRAVPEADLNIVIHPEYGLKTAEWLKETFGTPWYSLSHAPIGFASSERMMREVSDILNCDAQAFFEKSARARADAYAFVSRVNSLTGLPKGTDIAIEGTWSELTAYAEFLVKYFGMHIDGLSVLSQDTDCAKEACLALLESFGMEDALEREIMDTRAELVFASGGLIAALRLAAPSRPFSGIEISLPTMGYLDVIPKTHLGLSGALLLTEEVLNGLMF